MRTDQEIAWVDTETTGTRRGFHRIIEVAVMITDPDLNPINSFESKVSLSGEDLKLADQEALRINRYSRLEWAGAPPPAKVFPVVKKMIGRRITGGQNILNFDLPMIQCELARLGDSFSPQKRYLDTMPLCIMLMHQLDVRHPATGKPTAGLEFVYDAVGGPDLPRHRAMSDVRRAQYIYKMFRDMAGKVVSQGKGV